MDRKPGHKPLVWAKVHVLLAFKSGVRAGRQIYTGNIWEKSGFRKKEYQGTEAQPQVTTRP